MEMFQKVNTKIDRLYDVSIVDIPAYDNTRSLLDLRIYGFRTKAMDLAKKKIEKY